MIRTTDTGGVKMIYNGVPDKGSCNTNWPKLTNSERSIIKNMDYGYELYYGTDAVLDKYGFSYLSGEVIQASWDATNGPDLVGKYTCLSDSFGCREIYYVKSYIDSQTAELSPVEPSYPIISSSLFSSGSRYSSPGYMYNAYYRDESKLLANNTEPLLFADSIVYNEDTNSYTLSGTTKLFSDWSSNYTTLSNTRYTCWNSEGVCETVSYIIGATSSWGYYINLMDGIDISAVLPNLLWAEDVNKYDSTIKSVIDSWYRQYLYSYSNYLEETIFCNDRTVSKLNYMDPIEGTTRDKVLFREFTPTSRLFCENVLDQFSILNEKAKLTYSIGLMTSAEMNLLNHSFLRRINMEYYLMSPSYMGGSAFVNTIDSSGNFDSTYASAGVRPAISLAYDTKYVDGDGSRSNPYIVDADPLP